jgi:hypothetical protein
MADDERFPGFDNRLDIAPERADIFCLISYCQGELSSCTEIMGD